MMKVTICFHLMLANGYPIQEKLGETSLRLLDFGIHRVIQAINTFYTPDRKISIYVFGDDFSRGSVEAVCRYIAQINKADRFGNRLVRIHGIGFPTQTGTSNGAKFAHLMRTLSEQNGGTFVALPTL